MVFGLFAGAITSGASFVFPTFASYKAIKANDLSHLTPWLMFWSVQACLLFLEHWTYFLLQWIPLYKEAKMIFVLWMVLPQTQGSTYLYLHYLRPSLSKHEQDIDKLIVRLHDQATSRGGQYVQLILTWAQAILFGSATGNLYKTVRSDSAADSSSSPVGNESYVTSLLSRFRTVPVGSHSETIPSTLMGFLNMSARSGGDIIPSNLSPEERTRFVELQKSKLHEWLQMLDAAAASYPPVNVGGKRAGSRSVSGSHTPTDRDSDYEDVGNDESLRMTRPAAVTSGSWFWKTRASN